MHEVAIRCLTYVSCSKDKGFLTIQNRFLKHHRKGQMGDQDPNGIYTDSPGHPSVQKSTKTVSLETGASRRSGVRDFCAHSCKVYSRNRVLVDNSESHRTGLLSSKFRRYCRNQKALIDRESQALIWRVSAGKPMK